MVADLSSPILLVPVGFAVNSKLPAISFRFLLPASTKPPNLTGSSLNTRLNAQLVSVKLSFSFLSCPPGCADCLEIAHPRTSEIYPCLPAHSQTTPTASAISKVHLSKIPNTRAVTTRKTNCIPTDHPRRATRGTMRHREALQ